MSPRAVCCFLILALVTAGCAEVPEDPEARADFDRTDDPLEPMNRTIFAFNDFLDLHVMEPLARGYRDLMPEAIRGRIHDFLVNLNEPYVGGNELLKGEFTAASVDLGRFVINSTFGILGSWDLVAATGGPTAHSADLGLTLGSWGLGEGPYLMLPILGPSNPRDAAGSLADLWADPVDALIATRGGTAWIVDLHAGMSGLDTRVQYLDPIADIRRSSLDVYASVRSLYRQRRRAAVGDGGEAGPDL
ncbi:MAG TPA: VacJ family lipoprotein [Rhodospirillaceae bacterium]|nr:VacJ family lipoprotein [Rhodospirillaceae bacterium]